MSGIENVVMRAGTNAELPAHTSSQFVDVVVSHVQRPGLDLDLAVIAVDASGRVTGEQDLVFFNNPRHPSGAVEHLGQQQRDGRAWDAARVHFSAVPPQLVSLHATLSGEHEGFPTVPGLRVEVIDHLGTTIASIDLSGLRTQSAAMVLELYRRSGGWKIRAVAQGWDAGFPALVEHFGIEVGEPAATNPALQATAPPAPASPGVPTVSGRPAFPAPAARAPTPIQPPPPPAWPPATPPPAPAPSTPPAPTAWPAVGHTSYPPSAPPPVPHPGAPHEQGNQGRRGLFGPRRRDVQHELEQTRAQVAALGGLDALSIARYTEERRTELEAIQHEIDAAQAELASMRADIVETDEVHMLQSAGIYEFSHPLDDAVDYKARLKALKDHYKALVRSKRAVDASTNWQINGSMQEGAKMVKDTSNLMLRAYNAEADNCVRLVRPHSLDTNMQRLTKARDAITKLGAVMYIKITDEYHRLRLEEIRLTADYQAKVEQEREEQREARERAREDKQAQAEYDRERQHLDRERAQVERALDVALSGSASEQSVAQLRERLASVDLMLEEAELRAANARLGFVYVISNIGAFGSGIIKIGMTRRREPMDRVRELGDASVPFLFDVHALVFSEDALGLEAQLHAAFAHRRVNRVNRRREFFYATPEEVRHELQKLKDEHLLDFKETPLADEFRRSRAIAEAAGEAAPVRG